MSKLYANIGVAHENSIATLEARVVAAAQCNADAVIINKATPALIIPEEKKYVSVQSRWGSLPYLEVAKLSEITPHNAEKISELCEQIGIPLYWSVTDSQAAEFVKEHTNCDTVKLHYDSVNVYELSRYCKDKFSWVIYNDQHHTEYDVLYKKDTDKRYSVYYTTPEFPPEIENINLKHIDELIAQGHTVGYESRDTGVFPGSAVIFKGVDYIEKYLGDPDSDNPAVLTPDQFYDFYTYMEIFTVANDSEMLIDSSEGL